jgi:sugar phosphate isomerase/epimerase
MTNVAISSTSLDETDLDNICRYAFEHRVDFLELSGNISTRLENDAIVGLLRSHKKCRFYIHNYFPTPSVPFVLNLGHPESAKLSIEHCFRAVDLCSELGIDVFSIHAGMAFNPKPRDLGKCQKKHSSIDFNKSRELVFESCLEIAEYAQKMGVQLLIENNVVADFNCPQGLNTRYHFADPYETDKLRILFDHPNIGVLMDMGHLKVSAKTLNFEPSTLFEMVKKHVRVIHISENDGKKDLNLPISKESWFWQYIPWEQLEYICLEIRSQPIEVLRRQIRITQCMMV